MRYLYIDTSSNFLSTGIVENDKLVVEVKEELGRSLSEVALPKIAGMFEKANLKAKDIDKIIVVNGPGSFTGIRIGITIAKIYAWSLNIPISVITSLEAMALSVEDDNIKVPIINDRRGFAYSAIYDNDGREVLQPQLIEISSIQEMLKDCDNYTIISNDEFDEFDNVKPYFANILKIVETFKNKETISPHAVNPEYLKLTAAEESKK